MGQDSTADGAPRLGQDGQPATGRESLSATGMFEAVTPDSTPDSPAVSSPVSIPPAMPVPVAAPPPPTPFNPGMPVVHEVVFPSVSAASPSDPASLLSSLRSLASDERARAAELPPATSVQLREPMVPLAATPVPLAPEGGFTQLLRSLGETPPAQSVPPPQAPVPPPGRSPSALSFTKLMRALDAGSVASSASSAPPSEELPAAAAVSLPEIPASSVQATQVMPKFIPVEPSVEPPPVPSTAGSFTQLFQALDQQPAPAPAQTGPAMPAEPAESHAGSFTALFRTPGHSSDTPASTPAPVPVEPERQPGSFTQMFQAVELEKPVTASPAPPAAPVAATPSVPSSSGSFTQLFRSIESPGAGSPVPAGSPRSDAPPVPAAPPAAHSSGSFTELFRSIDPVAGEPVSPPMAPQPYVPPAPASSQPASSQSGGSFTQIFAAPGNASASGAPRDWGQTPQADEKFATPLHPAVTPFPVDPPRPDAGSLTQLLRTLEQPDSASPRPNVAPPSQPGAFTSIYAVREPMASQPERLSSPPNQPSGGYGNASQPASPEPQPAPSDFTRILQASSLREQALQRGEHAAVPAAPAATPPQVPQMPAFPGQIPQFPHPNALPPVNFGVAAVPPAAQPVKGMPALTPPPWMQPPAPPAPAVPTINKTQQLLPIILIGVIFLLVIVLVAVVFLMKR